MSFAKTRITLDMNRQDVQCTIYATKGDTARQLVINLVNNGMPYVMPNSGIMATVTGYKPDGTYLFDPATIYPKEGILAFDFTPQTCAVEGVSILQCVIFDGGTAVCAPRFRLVIQDNEYATDEVESASEFGQLLRLWEEWGDLPNRMGQAEDDIQKHREDLGQLRVEYNETVEDLDEFKADTAAKLEAFKRDNRPVDTTVNLADGTANLEYVLRSFISYCLNHSLYATREEAEQASQLREACKALLDGGKWLTGTAKGVGYHVDEVPDVPPVVDPTGWSIDGSGDWLKIISVPASAIDAAGDYIKIGG